MLQRLPNWFRGYLLVQIIGTAPERFINLCSNRKIFIWDLVRQEDTIFFKVMASNYKKLKPIARKTKIIPKIKKKNGFPFLLHRYRKRKGFAIGFLLCIILIYSLSLFIWNINIFGGVKYTPDAMIKFLKQNEIYTGIRKKDVNCQEIEEKIRLTYSDIGWVSAEMKGTRLIIKITETNMPAPAKEAIAPSHMVATKNAIIKSIITRTGTPIAREGDVVKKGDLLVSGVITVKSDFDEIMRLQPLVADADIICSSFYDYQDTLPLVYSYKDFTGKEKMGYYFGFFGKKLFLYTPRYSYDSYDIIVNEKTLHLTDSFYLPFSQGSIKIREYVESKGTYTPEQAISKAQERLQRYLKRLERQQVVITDNQVQISVQNNKCIAQGRILVEEPAWEYRTIQENEWRIEPADEHNGDNH